MPDLSTPLHLNMLQKYLHSDSDEIYGLEWGDPERVPPLSFIKQRFLLPYVNPEHVAVEIGPGGGRWTRYMLGFRKLYVVDYHSEILAELSKNFSRPNIIPIKNDGTDFPGIEPGSVDFLFCFGTFVHLELNLIDAYLQSIKAIVKPGANIVLHYGDKNKIMAQIDPTFSNNTPDIMRGMVESAGYQVLEEDLTTMWHSSVIRFTI